MKYVIFSLVILSLSLIFWLVCYLSTGSDKKNISGLRSYPDEVIKKVKENEELKSYIKKDKSKLNIFISNLILFFIIFFIVDVILNYTLTFNSELEIFIFTLIMGEFINLFDLVVIDLLWWRNTKRIRFSFIKDKEEYQNPKKHLDSFYRGILMYLLVSALVTLFLFLIRLL